MYFKCSNVVYSPGFASFINETLQGFLAGKTRIFIRKRVFFFKLHTTLYNAAIEKMPKYRRACNNPFHEKWSKGARGGKVINLRARGLLVISNVFQQFVEAEMGEKSSRKIINIKNKSLLDVSSRKFKEKKIYQTASKRSS